MIKNNYQTPKSVCEYMCSLLPDSTITVLEPTSGLGNLKFTLENLNYKVTAPENYFDLDPTKRFDAIVMNPPFSSKSLIETNAPKKYIGSGMKTGYYMLEECMEKSDTVIALMPWFTISDSDVRLRNIYNFGLKSITVLPRKTFNYARIQTCILELIKGFKGTTEFKVYEFI